MEVNELFSRISSRYSNSKSAYASLSRALKNLESLGQIKRKGDTIFITDKGLALIQIEMKEKLVIKLNEVMKKPIENIEEIVQLLIVLTERANESSDLLQNAKENALFTIKDFSDLQEKIDERKEFLDKMASLIGVQEERLRELNFNDSKKFIFDDYFVKRIDLFLGEEKLIFETKDKEILGVIPTLFKKQNSIIVGNEFKEKIFNVLLKNSLAKFTIYLPNMKIINNNGQSNCFALYKNLREFEKLK